MQRVISIPSALVDTCSIKGISTAAELTLVTSGVISQTLRRQLRDSQGLVDINKILGDSPSQDIHER